MQQSLGRQILGLIRLSRRKEYVPFTIPLTLLAPC